MKTLPSGQSASALRRLRRPLTEITMPTTGDAGLERPSLAHLIAMAKPRLAITRSNNSFQKIAATRKAVAPLHSTKASTIVDSGLRQSKPLDSGASKEHVASHTLIDAKSTVAKSPRSTKAAKPAKSATDHRSWLFEQMRNNIKAALGCASGLATLSAFANSNAFAANRAREQHNGTDVSKSAQHVTPPVKAAEAYCVRAFELMTANTVATLDFAQRICKMKSPAEFVELSASHTRHQIDLAMTYTIALRSISQSSAVTGLARTNAGSAKGPSEKK
jgi:hypothetical protein